MQAYLTEYSFKMYYLKKEWTRPFIVINKIVSNNYIITGTK